MTAATNLRRPDAVLICSWLGVPPEQWPPDHYTLLGLPPGEVNAERIEKHVHDRLAIVRRYQLNHAEAATEAMNRLAQAFVCLTDAEAKRAYDHSLFGDQAPRTPVTDVPGSPGAPTPADASVPELLALVEEEIKAEASRPPPPPPAPPPQPAPPPPPPEPPRIDPVLEAARGAPARRGLATRRALYYRIARTRGLLRAWNDTAEFLYQPRRKLAKPAEGKQLIDRLNVVRGLLERFPPLLGEAGQPGYLVVTLARQPAVIQTFQTLLDSQREALARDWEAGRKLLQAHKDFLRQELKSLRRKSALGRLWRAGRYYVREHPGLGLLALAGLALVIALARQAF